MSTVDDYIQVGTDIYKISYMPSLYDSFDRILIKWNIETFKRDVLFDRDKLRKYDGFCVKPVHHNYKQEYGKDENYLFYNKYHELTNKPHEGGLEVTKKILKHIFGDQVKMGLDYICLLYLKPTQSLPALCLVSSEKNSGKSTFIRWLKEIFEGNATYLEKSALLNRFNSHWTDKLLLFFEEAKFYHEVEMDILKDLITNDKSSTEKKGIDRIETGFFGKFILCSNHETNFIKIDKDETRFWVRKINPFLQEDPNILEKLKLEIPAFLYYLNSHQLNFKNETRHHFNLKEYKNDALLKVIKSSVSEIEINIAILLFDLLNKTNTDFVQFTPLDLSNNLKNLKCSANTVRRILKDSWKLSPVSNSLSYDKIQLINNEVRLSSSTGRYYTITREFLLENFDELMN